MSVDANSPGTSRSAALPLDMIRIFSPSWGGNGAGTYVPTLPEWTWNCCGWPDCAPVTCWPPGQLSPIACQGSSSRWSHGSLAGAPQLSWSPRSGRPPRSNLIGGNPGGVPVPAVPSSAALAASSPPPASAAPVAEVVDVGAVSPSSPPGSPVSPRSSPPSSGAGQPASKLAPKIASSPFIELHFMNVSVPGRPRRRLSRPRRGPCGPPSTAPCWRFHHIWNARVHTWGTRGWRHCRPSRA